MFRKEISDLRSDSVISRNDLPSRRRNTDVLIIDDEDFPAIESLKRQNFNITQKSDIDLLKDVEPYDIILCDVRGVGKNFGSEYGGAYISREIKKNYPEKTVIIYSAQDSSMNYQQFYEYADSRVPKGATIDEWISILDEHIDHAVDPIYQWQKMRNLLLNAGVSINEVANLESKYVKAVKSKNFSSFKKLQENRNNIIANIAKSILVSLICRLLTGGLS